MSRYQEWEDSMLYDPRGRGFSYSGSFTFKGPCGGVLPQGKCLVANLNQGKLPYFDLSISQILGLVFWWELKGIWR